MLATVGTGRATILTGVFGINQSSLFYIHVFLVGGGAQVSMEGSLL